MKLRLFIYLIVVIVFASCSSRYYMRRGTVIYETGRFHKASGKYEKAFNKAKLRELQADAAMLAGQCNEKVNRLKEAYSWYKKAERANKELPEAYLKSAAVNTALGDWETAAEYYRKYGELFQDERGKNGIYHLELLDKELKETGRYAVELKKDFNSSNSDFAPVYFPGDTCTVYFSSSRNVNPKKRRFKTDPVTGSGYSHIFVTDFTQDIRTEDKRGNITTRHLKDPRWLKPVAVQDSLNSSGHEGAMCFSADGNTLYFTSSRAIEGSNIGTRIYKSTRKKNEEELPGVTVDGRKGWTQLSKSGICGDSISVGHPALTPDGDRMYFVTDRLPGGFGGKDIWYVENDGGKWGKPLNAGEMINTPGDEMFPYVRENGDLYFASNGHYGFGGLDLFQVKQIDGKQTPVHLPAPLNSFADDFGIAFKPGTDEGLLTSSRSGRNDNIYTFRFVPQQLSVKLSAVNTITGKPVSKADVTVTSDDGSVTFLETDSTGIASMAVEPEREYAFVAVNPRFLKGKGVVSTYREKADRFYELTLEMQPIEKPIVIPNIYFDVNKWDLRPDAMENLEELLTILKDNPNITIELSAHTDMVGNDRANLVLSENRAKSVVDYLVKKGVYWDRLQAKGYGETNPRQINEKEAKVYSFVKSGDILSERFIRGLRGNNREEALQLNRRIEFKVLRTDYSPTANSLHNPNQAAVAVEKEIQTFGKTQVRDIKSVQGPFFTLQLGVFKNIPAVINEFKVVFTENVPGKGVRYCTGIYDTRGEAAAAGMELKKRGIESLVKEYK